jgi:Tfp pilus assembly protein PilF
MTEQNIQRATLLIEHRRYEDAAKELRLILASEPNHPYAHALLGVTSTELGRHDEALGYVKQALGQQPDNSYFLYLMGLIYVRKEDLKEASKFVLNAISFDPHNADYFGLMAMIRLDEKNWADALMYANRGLQADPENLACLNSRSTALLKLDRKDESYQTIKEALHNNPHNSHTHANLGWGLLERGDHRKALESFREALKLDPENGYAKAGLVEALKARYWFYRVFLQYVFWMTNKNSKYQWIFLIGLWVGIQVLDRVRESYPQIEPYAMPIIYTYIAFAISTWILEPLSNLFLRLNVYGRYALTKDQLKASTFTGIGFLIAIIGAVAYVAIGMEPVLTIYGIGFMLLCGSMFRPTDKRKRAIAMTIAIGLATIGLLSIALFMVGINALNLWTIFLWGTIAYQFIVNALVTR